MDPVLDVVIVTYNRISKLKKCLSLYMDQTAEFRNLIVVNNCSSDGTTDFLKSYKQDCPNKERLIIINLEENLGGSGGFYYGQKTALENGADWVLLADDDAYPDKDLVKNFYRKVGNLDDSAVAVCTTVMNIDGSIDVSHRRRQKSKRGQIVRTNIPVDEYKYSSFEVDLLSYVGAFIKISAMKSVGLVNKDFFIYEDDGEHSLRLRKIGKIVCYPDLFYIHDSGQTNDINNKQFISTWRDYYALRNYLYVSIHYKFSNALVITLKYMVKFLFWGGNRDEKKMRQRAISDAWYNRLGRHPLYKPGWSVLNDKQ